MTEEWEMTITGKDLIAAGYKPGAWFKDVLEQTASLDRESGLAFAKKFSDRLDQERLERIARQLPLQDPITFRINVRPENQAEEDNLEAVLKGFRELTRTPTVIAGAVMPDTCPTGTNGEIPVGGVIAAKGAIHPGMHSADICCSMFVTKVHGVDPVDLLDAGQSVTHFGPGGRIDGRFSPPDVLLERFNANRFLSHPKIMSAARSHFATQGDGNHFFYVGTDHQGESCIVTHHGSRGVGALLYKMGRMVAEDYRVELSPETPAHNAWIPLDSEDGEEYWAALQLVREWTRLSHQAIHDGSLAVLGASVRDRLWNEHNFCFREDDVIWHAKGATPVHAPFLPDSDGRQIIPLNMAQPILIVEGERNSLNMGFAPHGAGRNTSRSAHLRSIGDEPHSEVMKRETAGIDARFFSPDIDITELPSAYKNAESVVRDIEHFGLCRVVERIQPYGCIMGGDFEANAPWKRKKMEKIDVSETSPSL